MPVNLRVNSVLLVLSALIYTGCATPSMAQASKPEWLDIGGQNEILELFAKGKFAEAIVIAKADLAAAEAKVGPDSPELLEKIEQLGMLFLARSNIMDAEALFNREMAIARRVFGPGHPKTVSAQNALVAVYMMDGRFNEAAEVKKQMRTSP
jgi:pentatricopeptide repeat protein